MKNLTLITVFFCFLLFINCSSERSDDTSETKTPAAALLKLNVVTDTENNGNSADVLINYNLSGADMSTIKEVRLYFSTQSDIETESLLQVPASNYSLIPVSSALDKTMDANLKDTDGNPVAEGENYTAVLLAIYKDGTIDPLISNSKSITLNNEIFVTSMALSPGFLVSEDIAITSNGTLYINEGFQGNRLYKVTPDGRSSLFSDAMRGPVGIALDSDENVYTSNFNTTIIKKITPDGAVTDYITNDKLVGGGGLAFDNEGNLFNTFYATKSIFKMNNSGNLETVVTSNTFNGPVGVTYDKTRGKLFVASFDTGKIFYVADNGDVTEIADTDLTIGHLSYANDHFYATGWNQHKVYKIDLEGNIVNRIGSGSNQQLDGNESTAAFSQPNGVEATPDGKYVYVSQGNGNLRKIIMPRTN